MNWLYIEGNVPSLKNSKQIVTIGRHPRLLPSKTHQKYAKATKGQWEYEGRIFNDLTIDLPKPFTIAFYFVRDTKRKFDYDNAISTCLDLMVSTHWIEDDNMTEVIPIPVGYAVDKEKAGVYIGLLENINHPTPIL